MYTNYSNTEQITPTNDPKGSTQHLGELSCSPLAEVLQVCDVIWYDQVCDVIWYDQVNRDVIWYDQVCDVIWYDQVNRDVIWYDQVNPRSVVCCFLHMWN